LDIVHTSALEEAIEEVARVPSQALIINEPGVERMHSRLDDLPDLPYGTPVFACWLPGKDDVVDQLGIRDYLTKPVKRDRLLAVLDEVGSRVHYVLLVDDEPEALQLFERMLSSSPQKYRVLRALNGERALALLRERQPDVVIVDLLMPGMDGYRILREKQSHPLIRDIPSIVVSAQDPALSSVSSKHLLIGQNEGLSAGEIIACLQSLSRILAPPDEFGDQGSGSDPVDQLVYAGSH
jgi:CheY-like chemotaxis protein